MGEREGRRGRNKRKRGKEREKGRNWRGKGARIQKKLSQLMFR